MEHHHEIDATTCPTPGCGCTLKRIGEDISEKLDYTPGLFTVERHIRGKWACAKCQTLTYAGTFLGDWKGALVCDDFAGYK